MSRLVLITLPLLAVLATVPASAQKKKPGKSGNLVPPAAVMKVRDGAATEIGKLVVWCRKSKLFAEGRALLDEAAAYNPDSVYVAGLDGKLPGESAGSETAKKSYEKKLASLRKRLASYDKAISAAEIKVAKSKPCLRQARGHRMMYFVSLPSGWTKAKKWPVLVCVDGAGSNFFGCHNGFARARGSKPYIVVTPCSFWNTNSLKSAGKKYPYPDALVQKYDSGDRMGFDETGLLAALKDLQEDCNAEPKFYITGFSGGGNLTWRMVFGHPDKLAAASPACANFSNPGKLNTTAPERENLPIKAFQGDKDQYLDGKNGKGVNLNAQWEAAKKLCAGSGYKQVSRVMLPGVGHSGCSKHVIEFFESVRLKSTGGAKKRR